MRTKNMEVIKKTASNIWKSYGKNILSVMGYASLLFIAGKVGVPTQVSFDLNKKRGDRPRECMDHYYTTCPNTPVEAAIISLTSSARNAKWDTSRIEVAEKIYDIVSGPDIQVGAKTKAVMALNEISDLMDFDCHVAEIDKLIVRLTKGKDR